jgi:hypothetical protein
MVLLLQLHSEDDTYRLFPRGTEYSQSSSICSAMLCN